ncbi:hypothetical protein GGX14DRAFT_397495 [Mycena pura]|uniref:Uncharacterized protein n=1 Tax=Mycena pura TaxID=153505 RepID=A0AAD6V890_9AGAR|nr:hypothetical protein GGX14DRAFT_397495 [Mycena pura]
MVGTTTLVRLQSGSPPGRHVRPDAAGLGGYHQNTTLPGTELHIAWRLSVIFGWCIFGRRPRMCLCITGSRTARHRYRQLILRYIWTPPPRIGAGQTPATTLNARFCACASARRQRHIAGCFFGIFGRRPHVSTDPARRKRRGPHDPLIALNTTELLCLCITGSRTARHRAAYASPVYLDTAPSYRQIRRGGKRRGPHDPLIALNATALLCLCITGSRTARHRAAYRQLLLQYIWTPPPRPGIDRAGAGQTPASTCSNNYVERDCAFVPVDLLILVFRIVPVGHGESAAITATVLPTSASCCETAQCWQHFLSHCRPVTLQYCASCS